MKNLKYQIRINLTDEFSSVARTNPGHKSLKPLMGVLAKYDAVLKNQFDAFAGFVEQFETNERPELEKALEDFRAAYSQSVEDGVDKQGQETLKELVEEAEHKLEERMVLYRWTKDLVDNPAKEKQYANRFTVYADGGLEVYDKKTADGLERDLQPLVDSGMITKIDKFNSNPAENPQAPARFRR
jgi:hypothetical protein